MASRATARHLLARELGGEARVQRADARGVAAAGERLILRTTVGLSRSFGPYGAVSLVSRALVRAQAGNTVLAPVTITAAGAGRPGDIELGGLAASATAAGAAAAMEGVVAWLVQLTELLGELIGDDLAATILEQSTAIHDSSAAALGGADQDAHTTVEE